MAERRTRKLIPDRSDARTRPVFRQPGLELDRAEQVVLEQSCQHAVYRSAGAGWFQLRRAQEWNFESVDPELGYVAVEGRCPQSEQYTRRWNLLQYGHDQDGQHDG